MKSVHKYKRIRARYYDDTGECVQRARTYYTRYNNVKKFSISSCSYRVSARLVPTPRQLLNNIPFVFFFFWNTVKTIFNKRNSLRRKTLQFDKSNPPRNERNLSVPRNSFLRVFTSSALVLRVGTTKYENEHGSFQ